MRACVHACVLVCVSACVSACIHMPVACYQVQNTFQVVKTVRDTFGGRVVSLDHFSGQNGVNCKLSKYFTGMASMR